MEEIETLQFELESLLYTKTVTELQGFVSSEKLKTTIEEKSKIAALKIIQKCLDEMVNTEGEISEKVSWFKHAINSTSPNNRRCD
jgi:hypothetical protein